MLHNPNPTSKNNSRDTSSIIFESATALQMIQANTKNNLSILREFLNIYKDTAEGSFSFFN